MREERKKCHQWQRTGMPIIQLSREIVQIPIEVVIGLHRGKRCSEEFLETTYLRPTLYVVLLIFVS